jgi:crotonobetainyl-CoA:carnitine CoA-transferase CaiB-like acyl-CoA transferase
VYLVAGKRRAALGDVDLRALVLAADVLVEDRAPGWLAAHGLSPLELRTAKPSLLVVSITPFGQTGPYRDYKATNIVSFAMGSFMSLTGDFHREPLVSGGSQGQYFGGLHAFGATVTAYFGALMHGEGDWLDISLLECFAGTSELYGPSTAYGGPVLPRMGNQTRAEWGIYPCIDGWAGMFALQRQVRNLFEAVGDPELLDGPFLDPMYRLEHPEELAAKLFVFTLAHTMDEMLALGRQYKVPIGVALTPAELLKASSLAERGFWDDVATESGMARTPGRPFGGLGWRPLDRLHAPGEDTKDVEGDWLGGTGR